MSSEKLIKEAQDYLTIGTMGNGKRKIIDIAQLLKRHPSEEVLNFLKTMIKEKHQILRDLIITDKTKPEIDEVVAILFRVTMAIKTIEGEKEVKDVGRTKQRTRGSSQFP
jgi:hypothetical protein